MDLKGKKIGVTIREEFGEELSKTCHQVIVLKGAENKSDQLYELVKQNSLHDFYVDHLYDMGLQLVQLSRVFSFLIDHGKIIYFMDKGGLSYLDHQDYFSLLVKMAENEREILVVRTKQGVKKAKINGAIYGRPQVDDLVIERIKYLHSNQHKTIREIAKICNVSIGTAHKYSIQEKLVVSG